MSIGRTRRSSQNGPFVSMVPVSRRRRTALIFTGLVMQRQTLARSQLCFVYHAFVAVLHVLDAVLRLASFQGQQPLNAIGARRHPLEPARDQVHRLANLELVFRHDRTSKDPIWAFRGGIAREKPDRRYSIASATTRSASVEAPVSTMVVSLPSFATCFQAARRSRMRSDR